MLFVHVVPRLRLVSFIPAGLLELANTFLKEVQEALGSLPEIEVHQEGMSRLFTHIIDSPQGARTAAKYALDVEFFTNLRTAVVETCKLQNIRSFPHLPGVDAQAVAAGIRLARHFRVRGFADMANAIAAGVATAQNAAAPGSVRYAMFDTRMDYNAKPPVALEAATIENSRILSTGLCIGLEITDKTLAGQVDGNLDLQHTGEQTRGVVPMISGADPSWSATKWAAHLVLSGWNVPGGTCLVGYRADLDALASMALLGERFSAEELQLPNVAARIDLINQTDSFRVVGSWAPKPAFTPDSPWAAPGEGSVSEVAGTVAIDAVAKNARIPIARRVGIVAYWLRHGETFLKGPLELQQERTRVEKDRRDLLGSVEVQEVPGTQIAVVTSAAPYSLFSLLYRVAPVGVQINPSFQGLGKDKWENPGVKYTIGGWGDVLSGDKHRALVARLNVLERAAGGDPTWGGSVAAGIVGSSQYQESHMSPEQVVGAVKEVVGS